MAVYTVTKSRVNEDTALNCFKPYLIEQQGLFTVDSKLLMF